MQRTLKNVYNYRSFSGRVYDSHGGLELCIFAHTHTWESNVKQHFVNSINIRDNILCPFLYAKARKPPFNIFMSVLQKNATSQLNISAIIMPGSVVSEQHRI